MRTALFIGSLSGKTALVTGGARRIGRAIALALAEAGATVAITYRESAEDAAETVRGLEVRGVAASAHRCELGDPGSIRACVDEVVKRHGGVDVLVNNAGRFESMALEEISAEAWDAMFAVNTRGPFLMAQACLPQLRARRGRIVNVGSLGGMESWATHGHYCASKAALHSLSRTMAKAWAPEVSVNCVAPGMIEQGEMEERFRRFAEKTPMLRNGTAEEVAAAVLFFAAGPGFVTGQVLAVDGGLGL